MVDLNGSVAMDPSVEKYNVKDEPGGGPMLVVETCPRAAGLDNALAEDLAPTVQTVFVSISLKDEMGIWL